MSKSILMLANKYDMGGVEKHIFELASELIEKGFHVVVGGAQGEYVEIIKKKGIKYYEIPVNKNDVVSIFRSILQIRKIIKEEKIEIIHSHHRTSMFVSSFVVLGTSVVNISTVHNIHSGKNSLTRFGSKIIAVSNGVKKDLIENYSVQSDRIRVIYNGIRFSEKINNQKIEQLKEEFGLANKFVVGNIAALDHQRKGQIFLLEALKRLKDQIPEIKVVLVGKGNSESILRQFVKDNDLEKYVEFMGFQDDINSVLGILQVMILPSIIEGFPYVLIEAMSKGVPCIATRVGGNAEAVQHLTTGIIIEPKNCDAIVESINQLYNEVNLRNHMCENAKKIAKENFHIETMINNVIQVYLDSIAIIKTRK